MPTNSFTQTLLIEAKDNASQTIDGVKVQMEHLDKVNSQSAQTITQTESKFTKFGNSLKSNAGSITAVTGAAWGLYNAFDDLEPKMLAVQQKETKAASAAKAHAQSKIQLANVEKRLGKSSAEYAVALTNVKLTQDKATQAQQKATIAAGDLQEHYAQMAMEIGPQFAVMAGSVAQLVGGFGKMGASAATSIAPLAASAASTAAMGPAGVAAGAGSTVAAGGMKTASIAARILQFALGPIGLALIAIGVLFTLYATNAWGFADAVNGVAASIVKGAGQILTTVTTVGNQIGTFLTGFMSQIVAGNIPAALGMLKDLISGIFTEWIKPTFDKIYSFIIGGLEKIVTAIGLPIGVVKKAVDDLANFVFMVIDRVTSGISDAITALASGDIIGAIQALNDMFNDLATEVLSIIADLATEILTILTDLFTVDLPAAISEFATFVAAEAAKWPALIIDALSGLADAFSTEAPKWWAALQEAFDATMNAIVTNIPGYIGKFITAFQGINWADVWTSLTGAFDSAVKFIMANWRPMLQWMWDNVISNLTGKFMNIAASFDEATTFMEQNWGQMLGTMIGGIIGTLAGARLGPIGAIAGGALGGAFGGAAGAAIHDAIANWNWTVAWASFKASMDALTAWFATIDWDAAWASFVVAFQATNVWIYDSVNALLAQIGASIAAWATVALWQPLVVAFDSSVQAIGQLAFQVQTIFAQVATTAAQGVVDAFVSTGQAIYDTIVKPILKFPGFVWQLASEAGKNIVTAFSAVGQTIIDTILKPFATFVGTVFSLGEQAANNIILAFTGIPNEFTNKVVTPIQAAFTWEKIAKNFKPATDIFVGIADSFIKTVVEPIQKAFESLDLGKKFADLGKQITDAFNGMGVAVGDFLSHLGPQEAAAVEDLGGNIGFMTDQAGELATTMPKAAGATTELTNAAGPAAQATEAVSYAMTKEEFAAQTLTKQIEGVIDVSGEYKGVVEQVAKDIRNKLLTGLIDTATELKAQRMFWNTLSQDVYNHIFALQEVILAEIEVGQALSNANYAQNLYNEGKIAGKTAVKEFVDEIITSKGAYDAQKTALEGVISGLDSLGQGFSGLPGYIEPTIENLQTWARALILGGEAAEQARDMAVAAWESMTSAASSTFSSMIGVFTRTSEEMKTAAKDGVDAWNEEMAKLPKGVADALPPGTIENLKLDAEFAAAGQKAAQAFALTLQGNRNLGFDAAQQLAAEAASGLIQGFVDKHPEFANEAAVFFDAIKSGSATAVQGALDELSKMPGPFGDIFRKMKEAADTNLDGIPDILQKDVIAPLGAVAPAAGEAGAGAGIALSQEFAAASTHIAAVMKGIQGNIDKVNVDSIKQKILDLIKVAATPIQIKVDSGPVATNLNSIKLAIDALKQTKIPLITVNIKPGTDLLRRLVSQINGVKQGRIPNVTVNIRPGTSLLQRLQSQINGIRQSRVPSINVNISSGINNVNRIKNAINSIRGKTVYVDVRQRLVGPRYVSVSMPTTGGGGNIPFIAPMSTGGSMTTVSNNNGGGGGGRGRPQNFTGDVYLDTYRVGKVIGRAISENNV